MLYRFSQINNKGVVFNLSVTSLIKEPQTLITVGFDPTVESRVFFMREIFLNGLEKNSKYQMPCPLTSESVEILVFNLEEGNQKATNLFKVNSLTARSLGTMPRFSDPKTNEFIRFILPIIYHYEELPTDKWFRSDKGTFELWNKDKIDGTPARTLDKGKHHFELSREDMVGYPIPRKFMIMNHEFSHFFKNTDPDNESLADINGLKIYLPCNFPVIESVYTFTKILPKNAEGNKRIDNIINYLDLHNNKLNIFRNNDDVSQKYLGIFNYYGFTI